MILDVCILMAFITFGMFAKLVAGGKKDEKNNDSRK